MYWNIRVDLPTRLAPSIVTIWPVFSRARFFLRWFVVDGDTRIIHKPFCCGSKMTTATALRSVGRPRRTTEGTPPAFWRCALLLRLKAGVCHPRQTRSPGKQSTGLFPVSGSPSVACLVSEAIFFTSRRRFVNYSGLLYVKMTLYYS